MEIGSYNVKKTLDQYADKTLSPETDIAIRIQCLLIAVESAVELVYHVALAFFCHMNVKYSSQDEYLDWKTWRKVYRDCAGKNLIRVSISLYSIVLPQKGFSWAYEKGITVFSMDELCKSAIAKRTIKNLIKKGVGIAI